MNTQATHGDSKPGTGRDSEFDAVAKELGFDFSGELKIGGNYSPLVRDGHSIYVSGQIPRVGSEVVVVGSLGHDVDVERGRLAAKVCAMRALSMLRNELGTLDAVSRILRCTVFIRSASDFTLHSEVADGASDLLRRVLREAGLPTRTSVGVSQLPKGAAVELDLIASVHP